MKPQTPIYGVMAEFEHAEELLAAIRRVREAGYRKFDAYTPHPVEGLSEAMGFGPTRLPALVLAGGVLGALTAYGLQWYANVVSYPINVGGRPLNSWPAFIPITFELTVLFAGITAVVGMLALNGFPAPYHPVFNVPQFAHASSNRFFLCIEASDEQFDRERTAEFLGRLEPEGVWEVAH